MTDLLLEEPGPGEEGKPCYFVELIYYWTFKKLIVLKLSYLTMLGTAMTSIVELYRSQRGMLCMYDCLWLLG